MTEYKYRWVRTGFMGKPDAANVKKMADQGWEAVPVDELPPEPPKPVTPGRRWGFLDLLDPSQGRVGGLALYRTPVQNADIRATYYAELSKAMTAGAVESFLRDDPKGVKFAEIGVPDDDRENQVYGANFYSPENLAAHPERQKELDDYNADVAKNGRRFQGLLDQIEAEKPK